MRKARTKNDIRNHPWVYDFFTEDDGGFDGDRESYWVYLRTGFISPDSECGSIHEPTVADVCRCLNNARRETAEEARAAGHDMNDVRRNWQLYDLQETDMTHETHQNEQGHHYFATHALGYATAPTREEAVENLLLKNTDPKWVSNCLKDGNPLPVFTCRVEQPEKNYRIEWYQPVGVETREGKNFLVTYLTKKAYAVMDDLNDTVKRLEAKLDDLHESVYLDWVNNYLTYTGYAESLGITPDEAEARIEEGRRIYLRNTEKVS